MKKNLWKHEWYVFYHRKLNWLLAAFCLFIAVTGLFGLFYGNRSKIAELQSMTREADLPEEVKIERLRTECRYYMAKVVSDSCALMIFTGIILISIGFLADTGKRRLIQELEAGYQRKQMLRVRLGFYLLVSGALFTMSVLLAFLVEPEIYRGIVRGQDIIFLLLVTAYFFLSLIMIECIGFFSAVWIRSQWLGVLVFFVLVLLVNQFSEQLCALVAPLPEGLYDFELYFVPGMEDYREFPAFFLEIRIAATVIVSVFCYVMAEK